jgi:hypothetical protein
MKKWLILWFILLLIVKCTPEKNTIDPLINAYKVDSTKLNKEIIKDNLNVFLNKYNRNWSLQNKQKCIDALYCGQQEYSIDYKIVMSIIAIESEYKITAIGKNKNSKDFGLCQINSKYINYRYKKVEPILDYYKIKYTNSKFDISKNIFSCYALLRNTNNYYDLILFRDFIASYNIGVRGVKQEHTQQIADRYYERFLQEYLSI